LKAVLIGDVVGKPGRRLVREYLPLMRKRGVDFAVVNAENSAGGSGITRSTVAEIFESGAHVITTGDHVFRNKEAQEFIHESPRILRPENMSRRALGHGSVVVEAGGFRIAVVNLIGRVFMPPADCPFSAADEILATLPGGVCCVFVDFHAEATSEKIAMGLYLDGRVTAVVGTHTHVQTADETVLPGGTAYVTDLGMTGPHDSVIGRDAAAVLHGFTTGMPGRFEVAKGNPMMCGALVEFDAETGKALSIRRFRLPEGGGEDALEGLL